MNALDTVPRQFPLPGTYSLSPDVERAAAADATLFNCDAEGLAGFRQTPNLVGTSVVNINPEIYRVFLRLGGRNSSGCFTRGERERRFNSAENTSIDVLEAPGVHIRRLHRHHGVPYIRFRRRVLGLRPLPQERGDGDCRQD